MASRPASGEILVTGAAGGVGSVAVALLSKLGFRVAAMTGRPAEADFLRQLGAAEILDRAPIAARGKPLAKERWAAAIDVVGSHTLANVCASLRYGGVVAACGLAGGHGFSRHGRAVHLARHYLGGHRQCHASAARPVEAWRRLSSGSGDQKLDLLAQEISLAQALRARRLASGRPDSRPR